MAGIQILVVEDDALQAKLVSLLLEDAGHTVQIAGSAESALDVLQWFRPDLILMDLQLPGKDGLALTRELRLIPIYVATPIIALTAYTDASHLARERLCIDGLRDSGVRAPGAQLPGQPSGHG